jgi:SEC-C motif domain protein
MNSKKRSVAVAAQYCPCESGHALTVCCHRYHAGEPAPDAEALMRSRYTAYVLGNEPYLLDTWHPTTRPERLGLDAEGHTRWLGLEVRRHAMTGAGAAIVEFVARYKVGGRAHRLHETSRFATEDDRWYYVDGEIHAPQRS